MPRTFLALPLPDRVKVRLGEEADRLRLAGARVTWVRPRNYHVTVRFLGEVEAEELQILDPLLRQAAEGVGELSLVARGLGTFPEGRPPRVVWCGVAGDGAEHLELLQDLKGRIESDLARHGYRREKGPYHPHITLGRVRSPRNLRSLVERLGPSVRREFGRFTVGQLVLFESTRTREGLAYTPLQTFPLASRGETARR